MWNLIQNNTFLTTYFKAPSLFGDGGWGAKECPVLLYYKILIPSGEVCVLLESDLHAPDRQVVTFVIYGRSGGGGFTGHKPVSISVLRMKLLCSAELALKGMELSNGTPFILENRWFFFERAVSKKILWKFCALLNETKIKSLWH